MGAALVGRRRGRAIAAAALAWAAVGAGPAPAQVRTEPPPWSELEPAIARAHWVLVARVEEAVLLEPFGLQVTAATEETLLGDASPRRFHYLWDGRAVVRAGDRQLLLLCRPEPGGLHHRLVERVGAHDRDLEGKIAWMRQVLQLRRLPGQERGRAFVDWYARNLAAADAWPRERALRELERLRAQRGEELAALLEPAALERALERAPEGSFRVRLQALRDWRAAAAGERT